MFRIKRYYYFILILLSFASLNKLYAYEEDTPATVFLKYIGRHSYVGVSTGMIYTSFMHRVKSQVAQLVVIDKKNIYLYQPIEKKKKLAIPADSSDKPTAYIFQFLWPNAVHFKIDANGKLINKIEAKIKDMKPPPSTRGTSKRKIPDCSISGYNIAFPIRFSYLYEFESKKFRISLDPCLTIVRTSILKIKTISDSSSGIKSKDLGTVELTKRMSSYLEIPIGFYYRVIHSKVLDVFLCASAGLQFSSWKLGKPQDYFHRFWSLGLMFEYPDKVNFKPFLKLYFSKAAFPDPRIQSNKSIALVLNYTTFGIEFGARFRILPDRDRCGIPNCSIKYDHVHGRTNLRGRSFFNS